MICNTVFNSEFFILTPILPYARCIGMVWFGLFVHPFSHICNIGHANYRLQFTTQLIVYGHLHNTIY